MTLPAATDTVVIGAGQAGLTMSALLADAGRDHVVLERRSRLGGGWQDRWNSFCLVTPAWTASFPGFAYDGPDPDGYPPRDEVVDRLTAYASRLGAPVSLETEVRAVVPQPSGGFRVETSQGDLSAASVVVATGSFHVPRIPAIGAALPADVFQLHTHEYRDAAELPPGGVLVVGSGQSGVQIAEELFVAGRPVVLSVGSAGRIPRRYRGSDVFRWLAGLAAEDPAIGVRLPSVDELPDRRLRSAGNPHLSGHDGGHDTNLRQFAADGMTLIGRIEAVQDGRLRLAGDLPDRLAAADRFFDERFRELADAYIERAGIGAPPDDRVPVTFEPPVLEELDLRRAGIGTVLWATGYGLDYGWVKAPILDEYGFPRHQRGVTDIPGLYFLGLLWQHNQASATLFGVSHDARHLAAQMGLRPS
jgi:putative flavoprotein involved in K+ transport